MAIPPKPAISQPPAELPFRNENPESFNTKMNSLVQWYPNLTTTLQDSVDWADVVFTEVETLAGEAESSATAAANSATDAAQSAGISQSAANFRGSWSSLTGSISVPSSVLHGGVYWNLLNDLADVTASEPGVTADWSNVTKLQGTATGAIDMAGFDLTAASFQVGRYDLASGFTTASLNLASSQVFRISATSDRTISFINAPGSGRAMTVVVHLYNSLLANRTITWPSEINWADGQAPTLDGTKATVVLFWTGEEWIGSLGALS